MIVTRCNELQVEKVVFSLGVEIALSVSGEAIVLHESSQLVVLKEYPIVELFDDELGPHTIGHVPLPILRHNLNCSLGPT